ncbi:MAG: asparagine synthase C-terminal domain-containing protein, partial [Patescibacteria group bacterium]|nr:asparagine synthase C-terminal domain-containing protein [Patescibacteria group bacterium]
MVDRLRETLLDSVRAHYVADVPVGILFSGGNDSALLAALSREAGYSPRAYHLAVEGSSDTEYARQIARELNLQSDFIEMGAQELISQYEEVWKFLDVPFADISIIPTSLIYKKIAGRSKVVLSGEGGDEWFGGYLRHQRLAGSTQMSVKGGLLSVVDKLYGTSTSALTISNPLLRRVRNAYLALHDDVIGTYMAETKLIDYPLASSRLRTALYNAQATGESGPANLFFDRHLYLPNDLLMKTDLASMASSVEARVPFVDREVAARVREIPEFLQLSPRYRDKYLLKKILERYLPHHLIYRDKRGFGFSFERYHVPQFGEDVHKAIAFHHVHADTFGLVEERSLLQEAHADILIKKYPRFAFGL